MTRKFTFLLMALLALTGLKGWAQRGYTYERVTSFPTNPDPSAVYVLGYEDGGTYYLHSEGTAADGMILTANPANPIEYQLYYEFDMDMYKVAKCNAGYLRITNQVRIHTSLDTDCVISIVNGNISNALGFNYQGYSAYHDGNIIKAHKGSTENNLSFYKRTGSAAPTYTVTVTSDTEGCTASADKASYEEGETVTLSYEADAFHYFTGYESSDVTITGSTFAMPANNVSVTAHFAAKPTHSITATVNPENAGTASVTYQSSAITEAPAGAVLNLSAIANPGFDFVSWTIGDEVVSTSANYNYTMPDNDVVIVANFGEHQLLHVNIDPNIVGGTITVNPSECDPGTIVTVTPNAASGYQYVYGNITVTDANGQPVYVNQSYPSSTFEMPSTDVTVTATFNKLYSVSMGTVQNGSAYAMTGSAVSGATVSVFVTPNTGCNVQSVRADYEGGYVQASFDYITQEGQYVYSFYMPSYDVTVNVVCAQTYTVSYTQPTGGTISVSPTTNVMHTQRVDIEVAVTVEHFSFDYANYESKILVTDASQGSVIVNKQSDGHYYFSMPASDVTVSVIFDEDPKNNIAVTQPEGCTISVYPSSENVYVGTNVGLSYHIQPGYRFIEWVVKDGENPIQVNDSWFTMPNSPNVTVTANVQALTAHTVSIASGITGGSISARTDYDYETPINAYAGEYVYLTNTPEPGYQFISFTVTSECGTVEVYNNFFFYMPDCDVTVSATFIKPETLTVYDGTSSNDKFPIYTYWGDRDGTTCQFVIPAEDLDVMAGGVIKGMKFFLKDNGGEDTQNWECRIAEVDDKFLTGIVDINTLTSVFSGHGLSFTDNTWSLTFDTPFNYSGSNLLISCTSTTDASYPYNSFYGVYTDVSYYTSYYKTYQDYAPTSSTFIPKTEFTYLPDPTAVFYNIEIAQVEGGTITASKTKAKADAEIELSVNMDEGYTFNHWIVKDANDQDVTVTGNTFTMPASNVTVTAEYNALTRYHVSLDPEMTNGTLLVNDDEPDENGYLAGKVITISDNPSIGYKFDEEYSVKAWKADEPETEVTVTPSFSIEMPEYDIVISARFTELTPYTITYHVNGIVTEETVYENQRIYPTTPATPVGTSFIGWATSDIATYNTTAPTLFQTGNYPTDDLDLYAVFHYADQSKWAPVYNESDLSTDGSDRVIFAYYLSGNPTIMTYYDSWHFESTIGEINGNAEIVNLPANTTIFRPEKTNGTWKFYFDYNGSETTLADYGGSNLYPWSNYPDGTDTWNIYLGFVYDNKGYIGLRNNNTFNIHDSNQARLYKEVKPQGSLDAYFTEVFSVSGSGSMNEDMEARNLLINEGASYTVNGGKLTVLGFIKNIENTPANFVVKDGGQLVHYTEGVNATFEKNITGYTNAQGNDGYYLIANPTDETAVVNLTSNDFDLYTFDGAQEVEWRNAKEDNNFEVERGTGYLYANNETVTLQFAGELTPANSPDYSRKSLILAAAGEGRDFPGFNLIGNPFACNVYLDKPAYLLDGGEYQPIAANTAIAPCEGFFVEAESDGENLSISTSDPELRGNSISLTVSQNRGNAIDRAIVSFDGSSNLHKFMLNPAHTNIRLAKHGEEFAAISSEAEGEIPVSFKAEKNGSYTITVNTENVNAHYIHLIDNLTGADVDLLATPSYTFNASTSDYAYRFKLVFSMTGVEENGSNANSYAYISNGNLVIDHIEGEATMQIVDMLGRVVSTEIVSGSYNKALNLKAGLYIINLNGMTQKIVVK